MIQLILIGLIFLGALAYVGNLIYKSFQAKNACSTGCSKCGAVDLAKIEKQMADSNS
ncbi:MAG: FeoB-associated Cys-rich membrane protein [Cyclobacteriaceae bacterium]|nr:FeoB-associated Cys-rich membrane protein [Cyclobacteriaceae bacterium]